ncbi:MAG: hypothetical protein ACO3V2_05440 [Ilumatobacteraceae bacterium]
MLSPRAANDVEQLLAMWQQADDDAGRAAAIRRQAVLRAQGVEIRDYEFREKPNDWVHRDWMRPIRFVYRNIPRGVRMELKKRLAK